MSKSLLAITLAAALIACGQKAEQKPPSQTQNTPPQQPVAEAPTATTARPQAPRPAMKQSAAKVWVDQVTAAKGSSGSFKIHYTGVEKSRAMVVPLTFPEGMKVDSVSFANSMVSYVSTHPVRIDNDRRLLLVTTIPTTEPDIPIATGVVATVYFQLGQNAVSGPIDETFIPPGNYLAYVDTTSALIEPQFEPGQLTVK